jgi:hypothetical protein
MKKVIFFFIQINTVLFYSQNCATFNYKETLSGNDFVNFNWNPILKVCEDNKTIEFGSETFYISRSTKNSYGDYFYSIQEARGYGWPEIGYVKIASNFEIVELKFMNSIVSYGLISPYEMARIEKEKEIEREKRQKQQREEENRKAEADKIEYIKIDNLVNEKKFKEAYLLVNKLYSPSNYPKTTLIENALLEIDKNLNNTINEYAKNGDYIKAFESFDLLNFKDRFTFNLNDWSNIQEDLLIVEYKKRKDNSLSFLARKYLMEKYKDSSEELTNEEMNQIITENKSALSKLKTGVYDLKITNTGNLLIDNKDVTKEYRFTKKNKIFHDEFDIYINGYTKFIISDSLKEFKNSESTGNLTMIEWKLNPKHEKSAVYYKKNKELKFYSDKSGGLKDLNYIGGNGEKLTYDSGISKKSIRYSVIENQVKYVNGIIVSENPGLYTWIDKELIIQRHIVRKITYASLLGGLTWYIIRFREYVSANSLTKL